MHGENPFVFPVFKQGFFAFKRSLVCAQKKPCLHCKEALFANRAKHAFLAMPPSGGCRHLPHGAHGNCRRMKKGGAKTANLFISMIKVVSGGDKSALFFVTLQVKNCTRQCGNGFFFAAFVLPLQDAKPFRRVLYGKGRALFSKGSMPVSVGKGAAAVCKS